jgi:cytochrome c oxidase subunit II
MSAEEPRASRESKAQIRRMLLIGAIAAAVGIAVALAIDWFPTQASVQGEKVDTLWDVLLIASVPIFVLVETVVLYSAIKFRMRPGEELMDGPPIHGNTRLEIFWTAIPAILLVGLCTYAYVTLTDIEKAPAATPSMPVRVVGEQFTWTFYYKGQDGKEISSHQLYLPEHTPVYFTVQSKDVIHDFWVPAFRMKIDAVPGIETHLRVTTKGAPGDYPVVCAELCGLGHSTMRQTAHVMSKADFDKQLAKLASGPAPAGGGGGGGGGADAKTLFTDTAQPTPCASCHTLADAGANGTVGPNLDEVVPKLTDAEIRSSIETPNAKITEGYQPNIMPEFGQSLSKEQVDALVKYLKEVAGK